MSMNSCSFACINYIFHFRPVKEKKTIFFLYLNMHDSTLNTFATADSEKFAHEKQLCLYTAVSPSLIRQGS